MDLHGLIARHGVVAASFVVSLVSALFPAVNNEIYLAAVAAVAAPASLPAVLLAASLGHVIGKVPFYLAGRGLLKIPMGRYEAKIAKWRLKLEQSKRGVDFLLFSSASWGIPPFLVSPYIAGYLRIGFLRFFAWGLIGRLVRFAAIVLVPLAIRKLA